MQAQKTKQHKKTQLATRKLVEDLYDQNMVSAGGREFALKLVSPPRDWSIWTSRLFLYFGSTLLLAGIVFFFAFNWVKLGYFAKFGIIEAGIVLCLGGALYFSINKLVGRILALAACLLVGVFLAVYGQVYQTGADAYSLFSLWALLILPWAFLCRFPALWVFWIVIVQVALASFWTQAVLPAREWATLIYPLQAGIACLFLAAREYMASHSSDWKQSHWIRVISSFYVLGVMLFPVLGFIVRPFETSLGNTIGFFLGIAIYGGFYFLFRWKLADRLVLTAVVGAIATTVATAGGKVIFEIFDAEKSVAYLLLAIIILGISGIAIRHLRTVFMNMKGKHV